MSRRVAAIASVAALALAAAGCGGSGSGGGANGETLTVYVSAPLQGERAAEGRAIDEGARLALAERGGRVDGLRVRAVYLDDTSEGRWSLARSAANARQAAEDVTAIGYIGDLDSGATRASLPITNQTEMVQISPGGSAVDLTRLPPVGNGDPDRYQPGDHRTFARVVPADDVQGRAAAVWAKRIGARRVVPVTDRSEFGAILVDAFGEQARGEGIAVGSNAGVQPTVSGVVREAVSQHPDAIYFAGTADSATKVLPAIAAAVPGAPIFAPDTLLGPAFIRTAARFSNRLYVTSPFIDPSLLPPQGKSFLRAYRKRFRRSPNPAAAYGFESMALLVDAIRRAGDDGDDRQAVVDEVLSTVDRRSVLGTYSIDGNGDTTLDTVSGYRVSDGLPVFPVKLEAPR